MWMVGLLTFLTALPSISAISGPYGTAAWPRLGFRVRGVTRARKAAIWTAAAAAGIAVGVVELPRIGKVRSIRGAVVTADADPRKQLPLPNVEVTGTVRGQTVRTRSDGMGYFALTWPQGLWWGQALRLQFHRTDYQPLGVTKSLTRQIYIARLIPSHPDPAQAAEETSLSNLRVRYSMKATNTVDVGSTAKTFEVVNTANVPCRGRRTCSPDGRWLASLGSFELDAGEGLEFQNARVSCVAGPCPFTRIETDNFSRGGRHISGTVRAWSDTVTFLVEAEVVRAALSDMIRQSYPAIFGRTMTFTLPAGGEGPSIQADVNGSGIVFPLGPALLLSWASCNLQVTADRTKLYSCALKPGYRFR